MAFGSLTPFRSRGLLGGDPFLSLHREVNRLFDDALRGSDWPMAERGGAAGLLSPQVDISETENEIKVKAELPGVSEQDVDVELNDDILTIRGEKKSERKEEKENYHFMERSYGTFQRSFQLPRPVDADKVQATFENGVLTITLPKNAQQEKTRRIQVQGAGQQGSQPGGAPASGSGSTAAQRQSAAKGQ